jgi:YD repeat-containing protein
MSDELDKPFITVGGDGGTFRFTWNQSSQVREIHDNQPQYWIYSYLLENIWGDGEMDDETLVGILRYQADALEQEVEKAKAAKLKSYKIEVKSLSPEGMARVVKLLDEIDFTYTTTEEENN